MRFRNIFQPEDETDRGKRFLSGVSPFAPRRVRRPMDEQSDPVDDGSSEGMRYFDELQRINGTRGPALNEYQTALKTQPTREQYAPSGKRRILASVIGALTQDPRLVNKTLDDPYDKARETYDLKMRNLGESAKLEQDERESNVKGLSDAYNFGLKYSEFQQTKKNQDRTATTAEGNLKVNQQRVQAYIDSIAKPRHRYENQQNGSILEINEDTGATRIIPAKTVEAGTLGVARANAETNRRRQWDTKNYQEGNLIEQRRRTEKGTSHRPSPSEQTKAIDTALSLLYRDPKFKRFITVGDDSSVEPWVMTEDDGSPTYAAFKKRLAEIVKQELEAGSPFDDETVDDADGSFIIGAPEN